MSTSNDISSSNPTKESYDRDDIITMSDLEDTRTKPKSKGKRPIESDSEPSEYIPSEDENEEESTGYPRATRSSLKGGPSKKVKPRKSIKKTKKTKANLKDEDSSSLPFSQLLSRILELEAEHAAYEKKFAERFNDLADMANHLDTEAWKTNKKFERMERWNLEDANRFEKIEDRLSHMERYMQRATRHNRREVTPPPEATTRQSRQDVPSEDPYSAPRSNSG